MKAKTKTILLAVIGLFLANTVHAAWTSSLKITDGVTLSSAAIKQGDRITISAYVKNYSENTPTYDSWAVAAHDEYGAITDIHISSPFSISPGDPPTSLSVNRAIHLEPGRYQIYLKVNYAGSWYNVTPNPGQRNPVWLEVEEHKTYSWDESGDWSRCDIHCEQTREVDCRCDQTGDVVSDSQCSGSKPATSRSCTGGDCPTNDDPDDGESPTTGITSGPGEVRRGDTTEISFWGKDNKNLDRYEIMIFDGSSTLRKENTEHVSSTDVSDSYEFRVENDWDLGDAPIEIIFWDAAGNMERAYHWYEILATLETYSWDESGDWSRCDSSCMQYIDIPCRKESDGGEVDDQKCIDANLPKPATSQSCTGGDCPELKTWYRDNDGDGYGDLYNTTESSSQPSGYVSDNQDCDDNDSSIHPGATEICGNGIDEDCDGADLACPASPIILDKVEIQNEFTGAMNMEEVHPLPLTLHIRAEASGGNPDSEDVIPVRLEGAQTGFVDVDLIETGESTHIYETLVQIAPFSKTDKNTVAVVEDYAWGDGDRLIELVTSDGGISYGKAHALGSANDFPPANISAMNAAGYESISFYIDESFEPPALPTIFVKNQAKWFMYSGHGWSTGYCRSKCDIEDGGFVDMRDFLDRPEEERCNREEG